jgi:serine/threonine-protein kinase
VSEDRRVDAGGRNSDPDPIRSYVGRDTLTLVEPRPFGRYTIIARLGRGGTGDVFLALSSGPSGFQKLVVLKILHEQFEEDPDAVRMFLDEARIAARLHHPNVIQTFEVDEAEGRHFIAMEYAAGMGMDQILTACRLRGRLLPVAFCARVAAEILAGLAYAHGKADFDGTPLHIVHRDVSPANVIVGWDGTVKVVDFGIAKAKIHEHESDMYVVRGRFAYMAPEQARGQAVDHRADVWSAGVVLWEMLTGARLFRQQGGATTWKALSEAPIPAVTELRPEVPQLLSDIVAMALQRSPAERYPSAASMRHDLEGWLAAEGGGMNRDDVAATLGDYFEGERERQHLLLGESVGGLPLTSTGTGSFAVPPQPALDDLGPPSEEAPVMPRARMPLPLIGVALLAVFAVLALFLARPHSAPPREPAAVEAR